MRATSINGRWNLLLPEHRAARPEWPWWEATRLAAMHHTISRMTRPIVFDIGAEEGDFPALYASWGASVVLFEPNPKVWPNIRTIFQHNGLDPLDLFVGFAADTCNTAGEHELHGESSAQSPDGWPVCAHGPVIGDHGFQTIPEYPDTPRVTLDRYLDHAELVPDVVTMDVEGAELRVLLGADRLLIEHRPIVFVSVHPEFMMGTYGDSDSALHRFMAERGFKSRFLCQDHEAHWVYWHPEGRRFP